MSLRLLLFSDLHCDHEAGRRIVERAADVDVVVGAGDFARQHDGLAEMIRVLLPITTPTVVVPGNNETADDLDRACAGWASARVLHGGGVRIGDHAFFGIGGGVPETPFGAWSYDFSEARAARLLEGCPERGVIISHSPPHGHGDLTSLGTHAGSTAVRDAALRTRTRLVVCGHIHDAWGSDVMLESTRVINAGPDGVVVDI